VEFSDKKRTYIAADVGVPQGGIVSPLLSNLVLHELDLYVEKLKLSKESASLGHSPSIPNPLYKAATYRIGVYKETSARTDLSLKERNVARARLHTTLQERKRHRP